MQETAATIQQDNTYSEHIMYISINDIIYIRYNKTNTILHRKVNNGKKRFL